MNKIYKFKTGEEFINTLEKLQEGSIDIDICEESDIDVLIKNIDEKTVDLYE